jgi:hypothetical protein
MPHKVNTSAGRSPNKDELTDIQIMPSSFLVRAKPRRKSCHYGDRCSPATPPFKSETCSEPMEPRVVAHWCTTPPRAPPETTSETARRTADGDGGHCRRSRRAAESDEATAASSGPPPNAQSRSSTPGAERHGPSARARHPSRRRASRLSEEPRGKAGLRFATHVRGLPVRRQTHD